MNRDAGTVAEGYRAKLTKVSQLDGLTSVAVVNDVVSWSPV